MKQSATFLPLVVLPVLAPTVLLSFDAVPDFVHGLVTGASVALLLGYCIYIGSTIGATKTTADARKLDELDPLGNLSREQGSQR